MGLISCYLQQMNAAILNDEQGENKSEAYTELTQVTLAKLKKKINETRQGDVAKLTVTYCSEKKEAVADKNWNTTSTNLKNT